MAGLAIARAPFFVPKTVEQHPAASLHRISSLFFSLFDQVSSPTINLKSLHSHRELFLKRIDELEETSNHLIADRRSITDTLSLELRLGSLAKKKLPIHLQALSIDMPLFESAPSPVLRCKDHLLLFRNSFSRLELKERDYKVNELIKNYLSGLNLYGNVLNSLFFIKQHYGKHLPSNLGYIPRETLNLIQSYYCKPIRPFIVGVLGKGSYGTVERIAIKSTQYAYKFFHEDIEKEFFLHESGIHLCIPPHKHIVNMMALACDGIVLEFLSEGTLYDAVMHDRCGYQDIVNIFLCLTLALKHIHTQGYNYKDLKMNNVMLDHPSTEEGPLNAKLCDMGFLAPSHIDVDKHVYQSTAAPEVFFCSRRTPITPKSDIWSLGVILFQTLAGGQLPFYRDKQHRDDYHKIVATNRSGISTSVDEICRDLKRDCLRKLKLKDPQEALIHLVCECLDGRPLRRLSTEELISRLSSLKASFDEPDASSC